MTSNKATMVGFDDVLLQLLDQLTGFPSSRQVIPIVGMGGISKTTLATNTFQHPFIVQHFDVCLWATISQQYIVHNILTQLVSVDESSSATVDELGQQLYKSLRGRRYLIVLDDMWSVEAWDEIKFFFPDTHSGSRIVVTTRHLDVANHLGVSHLAIDFLDEENSWDLFCQTAFAEQGCPSELEEYGKKIVEKCKGLPLAIVVVGGHLRKSSMAVEYWENVVQNMNSILEYSTENDEQCLNILSLSYSYLPARLKPCFLFLGAFPEDELIYVSEVLKLWIAKGFIEHFENLSLEKAGENYIRDLSERNLILVDAWDYNGEVCEFKVHDLVRELCLKIGKKDEFLCELDSPRTINRERRVVISGEIPETKTFDAPIRCLICEGGRLLLNFKLLRTVHKVVASSITDSTFQQLNLRYLKVDIDQKSRTTVYLPPSISLLWNLQILRIVVPTRSTAIAPYEIWEMVQLRHLEVYPICLVDPLPVDRLDHANDLVLRNLYTLSNVENLRLSEEVCKRIPHIRVLRLSYCDEVSLSYCPSNLGNFHELEHLLLKFDGNSKWHDFCLSLTFPISLKWLYLRGCGVDWDELTIMVGSLPNLVCLKLGLNAVIGSVWSPIEGKFLRLTQLEILDCDDLIYWNAENFHFPVLEILCLENLSKLDEFPSGIEEIATLGLIEMEFCSESSSIQQ
ncbi:putative late blight resistance protein homolog R1B-16 [Salvia miltiorrhiza]|uniref:putative late blight resistance protein homolog R1B-16 n=1 Tax=Salvia miltiorrhiza TaxID=226208 RepID=UPI0025ABE397|nr:putative late blight resistance protein homolog R1B-16 [Salvia miltiorrhiza]